MEFHLRLQFYSIPFLVETPSLAFSTHSLLKVPNSRIIPTLTFQFQSPDPDCISDSTFYLQHFSDQLKLDARHKYYYQVQMQISICEVNYCNFVVWTLASMVTIRVYRNEAFFHQIQPSLWLFFEKHILPELLTRSLQHPVTAMTTCSYNGVYD